MAPPLRKPADNEALWDGLKNNEIDTVATDHCPFTFKRQKQQGADDFTKCPSGAPGVEERKKSMVLPIIPVMRDERSKVKSTL